MKEKKKRKRQTLRRNKWPQYIWQSISIGACILGYAILALTYNLALRYTLPPIVIGLWILTSFTLWSYASAQATHDMWWKDDKCSGWRGY